MNRPGVTCLLLPLEDFIDELPTESRRWCPVNGCAMQTGPEGAVYPAVSAQILHWVCPICAGTWHRWPADHPLRRAAAIFVGRA